MIARYACFAGLATLANLAAQRLVLGLGLGLVLAILVGTAVGLALKYTLDKRWIFYDGSPDIAAQFSLYTVMGLVTTAVFWGFESSFWFIWQTDLAREIGAVIGLTIGYVVKYHLDCRFVFNRATPVP